MLQSGVTVVRYCGIAAESEASKGRVGRVWHVSSFLCGSVSSGYFWASRRGFRPYQVAGRFSFIHFLIEGLIAM